MDFKKPERKKVETGYPLFAWRAYDHQPVLRGWLWYILFCGVLLGGAAWSVITDPKWGWLMALTFCVFAAVYFWSHRKGNELHEIAVFEKGIRIGEHKFVSKENIAGYWFVYEPGAEILKIELRGRNKTTFSLQMGGVEPDFFREHLTTFGIEELEDREEASLDKWIRIFKL